MWRVGLVVVMAAGVWACGGDGATRVDGRMADALVWPADSYRLVRLRIDQQPEVPRAFNEMSIGTAQPGPGWCFPDRVIDSCVLMECQFYDRNTAGPNPGAVHFGGDVSGINVVPEADGHYPSLTVPNLVFSAGATVHIIADGGDVPALSADVTAPTPITVPNLMAPTIPRSQPYTVTWMNGVGPVHVTLSTSFGVSPHFLKELTCEFDASAHSATISPAALGELPAGAADLKIASSLHTSVTTTAGPVQLYVVSKLGLYTAALE